MSELAQYPTRFCREDARWSRGAYSAVCAAWPKFDALSHGMGLRDASSRSVCGRDAIVPRSGCERGTIAGRLHRYRICKRNELQCGGVRPLRWLEAGRWAAKATFPHRPFGQYCSRDEVRSQMLALLADGFYGNGYAVRRDFFCIVRAMNNEQRLPTHSIDEPDLAVSPLIQATST
jgi:hypothetical protein